MDPRSELLNYLAQYGYNYSSTKQFLLSSGVYSNEYLNCKNALSHPGAIANLGIVCFERLISDINGVGGLTMGADPIAMAVSYYSFGSIHPIRWFTVRKERKAYGKQNLIEGNIWPKESVAIVDDVVTTGKSTIQAINYCRDFGLKIAQVLVLVDRQEKNGMDNIIAEVGPNIPVSAIFTKQEIKTRWEQMHTYGFTSHK